MALKIIAVDDEPDVLRMIKSIVEPLGCEILTVADSLEASRRLANEKFDGIFLDVQMPNMDGFQLAQQVRRSQLNRETPIVMLTGQDDVATMRKGFQSGVSCFLGKPISWQRMYSVIKAMRGPMLQEKRRTARLPFQTSVKCKTGPTDDQHFMSVSMMISEHGMFLGSSGGLEAGQELEVEFRMPDIPTLLNIRSKVVRKEPPDRIAIEFLNLAERDRDALRRYIAGNVIL